MKRILLLLLMAASCQLRAQTFIDNLNNFRSFNAGYGALTGTSVIHPPMVFGNVDSVCNYLEQLYGLIGASDNLQSVTAAGNSTTFNMYSGNSGTASSPNTGVLLEGYGVVYLFNSGINIGGISAGASGNGSFFSRDISTGNSAVLQTGPLTNTRFIYFPDEGQTFVPIPDTVLPAYKLVLHKTKDNIIVGDTTMAGSEMQPTSLGVWKSGVKIGSIDNVNGTFGQLILET
jgi:hypothetical protein